ncbi:MAG: 50S ribosomal protein L10 [Clostridiaceae bacterium]|nr:50S ribosomal protein L10 [Clostridiaceae bacterium]
MASASILELKKQAVEELKAKILASPSFVLVDYKGLNAFQDNELRVTFRKSGVKFSVIKNRIAKIALNELGYTQYDKDLEGPTAIAFASTDVIAPAKIALDGVKKYVKIKVKSGMVDGSFIDLDGVKALSELPPKEVLIAKLLGTIQAPISNLVYVLNGTLAGLAICLNKIAEQKGA